MTPEIQQERVQFIEINDEFCDQRIDNFLIKLLKGVPKSRIYSLLRKGEIRVNKKRIKADYRLNSGDVLRLPPIRVSNKTPVVATSKRLKLLEDAIVFENDTMVILNKPSGMAVHGGSGIDLGVIELLRQARPTQLFELAHRIDRDTSGLLIVAKTRKALRELHDMFRNGSIEKTYRALVAGHWPKSKRRIEFRLQKNELPSGEMIVNVDRNGKEAITEVGRLVCYRDTSLLSVRILTGRTHQIRVHTAHSGYPVIGDEKYGDERINRHLQQLGCSRLFLHAFSLRLQMSDMEKPLYIEAPMGDELMRVLQQLENEKG